MSNSKVEAEALFKLSYGLYVLTAKDEDGDNGCIINTAMQVTDTPKQLCVAVNKNNHTHDMIVKTGVFNLSVLTEAAPFAVFERFGFSSGRDTDKFAGYPHTARSENGLLYTTEAVNAFFSAKVIQTVDCGTHTMFIAEVTEAKTLNEQAALTYSYYFEHIKPKPQAKVKGYVCKICGFVYEGDPLPEDYVCPLCNHGAEHFEPIS